MIFVLISCSLGEQGGKDNSEIGIVKLVKKIAWRRDLGNCRKKRISKVSKDRAFEAE